MILFNFIKKRKTAPVIKEIPTLHTYEVVGTSCGGMRICAEVEAFSADDARAIAMGKNLYDSARYCGLDCRDLSVHFASVGYVLCKG